MRLLLILLLLFISCNTVDKNNPEKEIELQDSATIDQVDNMYIWDVNSDSMIKRKNRLARPGYYDVDALIKGLNFKFPHIQLRKLKLSNDTLYVKIDDATYLTQQMGSSGPVSYIANVFMNLTSVPGINYVNLDFEEGDHASPGVLRPQDFKDYKEE